VTAPVTPRTAEPAVPPDRVSVFAGRPPTTGARPMVLDEALRPGAAGELPLPRRGLLEPLDPVDPGTLAEPVGVDAAAELVARDALAEPAGVDGSGGAVRMVGSGAGRRVVGDDSDAGLDSGLAPDESDEVDAPDVGGDGNVSGRAGPDAVLADSVRGRSSVAGLSSPPVADGEPTGSGDSVSERAEPWVG